MIQKIYIYNKVYNCYTSSGILVHIPFVIKISKHEWSDKEMTSNLYKQIDEIIEHSIKHNVYTYSLDDIYYKKFKLQYSIYVDINYELSELDINYYVVDIYTNDEIFDDANYLKNIESYQKNIKAFQE